LENHDFSTFREKEKGSSHVGSADDNLVVRRPGNLNVAAKQQKNTEIRKGGWTATSQ